MDYAEKGKKFAALVFTLGIIALIVWLTTLVSKRIDKEYGKDKKEKKPEPAPETAKGGGASTQTQKTGGAGGTKKI